MSIIILDNGSQYTHLIKRNCRDLGFDAVVVNTREDVTRLVGLKEGGIKKVILSGGPGSAYNDPPNLSSYVCDLVRNKKLDIPLLGICYGHQMIGYVFGARVAKGKSAEYGVSEINVEYPDAILKGVPSKFRAWVSHFDEVKELPSGFVKLAHSDSCAIEAMRHESRPIFGLQFHPEVWHTEHGETILKNFLEI